MTRWGSIQSVVSVDHHQLRGRFGLRGLTETDRLRSAELERLVCLLGCALSPQAVFRFACVAGRV